jgi:hypothetical protein
MNNRERQENELEFVKAAYEPTEAWCSKEGELPTVHRSLKAGPLAWLLRISLPEHYPGGGEILHIELKVDEENTIDRKVAFQQQPALLKVCQQVAESLPGEEALYVVLNAAEQWIHENKDNYVIENPHRLARDEDGHFSPDARDTHVCLGRKLIYSHHIISKRKRADILDLARQLNLTGFMKIGWPGIIIVEGSEEDCQLFYDGIKVWSWQYLVVRGEMQEKCKELEKSRQFPVFAEVNSMSVVANHCREVGLEALFRTSMKVYGTEDKDGTDESFSKNDIEEMYGALVLVDHMNDGSSYRKWLRKACHENDVLLMLQQFFPNDDYLKRPKIVVGLVGGNVKTVLKQWRTRKVDVDSKGKPCLERMMTVLVEGVLENVPRAEINWDEVGHDERFLNTTTDKVKRLANAIGGKEWRNAFEQL